MDETFKQQLIARFHLEHLDPNEAEAILSDAGTVIMNGVITRGIPLLDEKGSARCDELLASDADITEIFKLLQENVPTFENLVIEELELLEKTLV